MKREKETALVRSRDNISYAEAAKKVSSVQTYRSNEETRIQIDRDGRNTINVDSGRKRTYENLGGVDSNGE